MSNWLLDYFQTVFVAPDEWFVGLISPPSWNTILSNLLAVSVVLLALGALGQVLMARVQPARWSSALSQIGLSVLCFYLGATDSQTGRLRIPMTASPRAEYVQTHTPLAQLIVGDNRYTGAFVALVRFNHQQLDPLFQKIRDKLGRASERYRSYYDSLQKVAEPNLADLARRLPPALGVLAAARDGYGSQEDLNQALGSEAFSKRQETLDSQLVGAQADASKWLASFNATLQMFMAMPSVYLIQTLVYGAALHIAVLVFPLVAALMMFGRIGYLALSNWLSLVVASLASLLFMSPILSFALDLSVLKPLEAYMLQLIDANRILEEDSQTIFQRAMHTLINWPTLDGNGLMYAASALFLLVASLLLSFFLFRSIHRIFGGLMIGPAESSSAGVAVVRAVRSLARRPSIPRTGGRS